MTITQSGYEIRFVSSRHGHTYEVLVVIGGQYVWVDLETGRAREAWGHKLEDASPETLCELREATGWKEPIVFVDVIDDATGEWTVKAEPCFGCEQLKRVEW